MAVGIPVDNSKSVCHISGFPFETYLSKTKQDYVKERAIMGNIFVNLIAEADGSCHYHILICVPTTKEQKERDTNG